MMERGDGADGALLETPAQEEMGDGTRSEPDCRSQVRDALEGVVGALLSVAMGLVLITLGLPAFLLVGSLDLLGNVYEACGGDRKDWSLFVVGADKPDAVPEQCNREAAGKMEAMRGQGPWPNFVYHLRNNHPVFGIFCCEHGHPFSPVERMGLLVLLLSFAYFMAGLKVKFVDYTKHTHWNDQWDWLWIDCYSLLCITLPSMVLQTMLKYFALLNYKYVLNKYNYFAKVRDQRCRSFARQFCADRGLGIERPRTHRQQGTGFGGFGDCDCLQKCCKLFCKLSDACKACNNSCEDGKAQAVNSLFASLFAGLAFAGSCVFVVLGIRLDMDFDADEDGQLSLREIEAIRSEFAAKAGWWTRPEAP